METLVNPNASMKDRMTLKSKNGINPIDKSNKYSLAIVDTSVSKCI